ncbi:MAG: hypothetical protein HWN80_13380 [Candidatus Lokiarchaeota archaeon]|nr:hypothetical protein [Candidatus Lokiarchaeota archaeon]
MAIQITKMIFHGILNAILYIALPLILFEVISMMGLMTFTQEFKTTIIIIGIIGTVFAMIRHAYPKDTSANRLIAFGSTIYSGIYMFYLFGGFTPGVQLGMYSINLPTIQVQLGLQTIAWLLLGSSGIRAMQYLIEAIELRKGKEYRAKIKLSILFKVIGTIFSLAIAGYLGSIVYSGMNLGFSFHPSFVTDYDDGGTPLPDLSDDTISINVTFDLNNQGFYAIYNAYVGAELSVQASTNTSALPLGLKVGGGGKTFDTFHSFTNNINNTVTIVMDTTYIFELATTDATLELKFSFNTIYATILINLNLTVQDIPWTHFI